MAAYVDNSPNVEMSENTKDLVKQILKGQSVPKETRQTRWTKSLKELNAKAKRSSIVNRDNCKELMHTAENTRPQNSLLHGKPTTSKDYWKDQISNIRKQKEKDASSNRRKSLTEVEILPRRQKDKRRLVADVGTATEEYEPKERDRLTNTKQRSVAQGTVKTVHRNTTSMVKRSTKYDHIQPKVNSGKKRIRNVERNELDTKMINKAELKEKRVRFTLTPNDY